MANLDRQLFCVEYMINACLCLHSIYIYIYIYHDMLKLCSIQTFDIVQHRQAKTSAGKPQAWANRLLFVVYVVYLILIHTPPFTMSFLHDILLVGNICILMSGKGNPQYARRNNTINKHLSGNIKQRETSVRKRTTTGSTHCRICGRNTRHLVKSIYFYHTRGP